MAAEQTAFPRGKRKLPSTTTASSASSSTSKKDSNNAQQPSKKRATTATTAAASSSSATAAKEDFLFGNTNELDAALQKQTKSYHKRDGDYNNDDDEMLEQYESINSISSALPLGGGAVLPPATTSSGKRIPPKIEALSFGKFARGTKVLGVVREVTDEYAVVSLPTMLTGFVRRDVENGGNNNNGGAPLTKVLPPVNSIMAFYVLSTTTEDVSSKKQQGKANTPVVKTKRRIELSPLPGHVNTGLRLEDYLAPTSSSAPVSAMVVRGRIISVEDHGCIVDLGGLLNVGGVIRQAFLKFENVEGDYEIDDDDDSSDEEESDDENEKKSMDTSDKTSGAKRSINPGRIYDFSLLPSNIDSSFNILQLALPTPSTLATLTTSSAMMPSISSLQPGMLISEVQVEAHAKNGMCVAFNKGVYRGSLDEDHLGGHRGIDESGGKKGRRKLDLDGKGVDPSMWWKGVFKGKHAKFTARIIAVDTTTKIVRFSLNPHILAMDGGLAASFPHTVGSIIKNAQVIRVDPGIGALLALPPNEVVDDQEEEILTKLDKSLANNLLNNSVYKEAAKVRTAYVHISKSMDNDDKSNKKGGKQKQGKANNRTPEALFARHFSINTTIKSLRILSTSNLIDNIASCATAKSIVEAHVLTHADLKPGMIYKDVPVLQLLESGGVLVDLGVGTKGIVPSMHLFDKASHGSLDTAGDTALSGYRQKIRSAKYKVGNVVTVRCLTVDAPARQCVLTAKKTLLSGDDGEEPIVNYTSVKPGQIAPGFISKVDGNGLTVTFYNNVHGRVSSRSLASELGVEDVKLNYSVGDAVVARIVACERRRNRNYVDEDEESMYFYMLKLSLKTVVEKKKEEEEEEIGLEEETEKLKAGEVATVVPLAAGSLLMPKRMKVLQLVSCLRRDDGVFLPGYAVVSIKSKFFTKSSLSGNGSDAVECKLPYDHLLDSYSKDVSSSPKKVLDGIAKKHLTVGKRIEAEGLILTVPNGMDALPMVSLRPALIDTIKKQQSSSSKNADSGIICPSPSSNLFLGEFVRGYVTRIDSRYGAFVRFLGGLTGLIPKLKKGLNENLYDTVLCKVTALDITSGPTPKILLKKVSESEVAKKNKRGSSKKAKGGEIHIGDIVGDVTVVDINFARAKVYLLDNHSADSSKIRARIHVTMADALSNQKTKLSKKEKQFKEEHKIGKNHPFYDWKVGDIVPQVRCVAMDERDGVSYVELANLTEPLPSVVSDPSHLPPGSLLSAIVTSVSTTASHHGLWVQVCPGISGFVPALELSNDPDVLNDIASNFMVGTRISCCVMAQTKNKKLLSLPRQLQQKDDHDKDQQQQALELSVLLVPKDGSGGGDDKQQPLGFKPTKPHRGHLVVGRINAKTHKTMGPPSLMLNLRGNFVGRCCITELADVDGWENMPLGKAVTDLSSVSKAGDDDQRVVSDSDADPPNENEDNDMSDDENEARAIPQSDFPEGKYVKCCVLGPARSKGAVELSLRESRVEEGNLEDDPVPSQNGMIHAYVVSTTKKGCFIRLSRSVEGRVILKELSDDFIPNPSAMFPPGRLVVGKVKQVKESNHGKKNGNTPTMVDIDMRESVLLATGDRLSLEDVQINSKYTGVISRVESYGVFVKIDNSDVSGLAHVSECSDSYVKNLLDLYNPGDCVKVMLISMDKEEKGGRLGFSLKASNFVDDESDSDEDSDDESVSSGGSSSSDGMELDDSKEQDIDSDDEDFASKLAAKMEAGDMDVDEEGADGDDSDASDSESDSSESDDEDELKDGVLPNQKKQEQSLHAMETDVGFDWGGAASSKPDNSSKLAAESSSDDSSSDSSDSESDEDDDDADSGFKTSHKSRKKAAAKRREEEETSRRESALADGTADETPETSADFERLVASSPNSSEVWIRYMAFHLSLADIESARSVASRAFDRIEFRQEGEKLNVWTALLTLELKYGTEKSLQGTVDRACQQNNPKQVYLRVCELLDKEVDAASSAGGSSTDLDTSIRRANDMFTKMCKKFKSKKAVWLVHFQYLLKGSRHEEAHALLKRSLQSLPQYKHVEVMSKFAQMEFEFGSPERGRTIFNALLEKHPKRMDLLFVNIDKEVKNGDMVKARALFDSVVNPVSHSDRKKFKFSDKQMKSLFKKWYRTEEEHGDEESQERVKEEARVFVSKTNA